MTASIGEADLGVGEDCAIGHDPDVAHDGQVEAGAEGETVDSGDERLGEADDGPMEPARRLVHALEGACVVGTQLIAVEAGAEAAANASDYGDGDSVVGGDALEHVTLIHALPKRDFVTPDSRFLSSARMHPIGCPCMPALVNQPVSVA